MAQRKFRLDDTSTWNDRYGSGTLGDVTYSADTTDTAAYTAASGTGSGTALTVGSDIGFSNGDLVLIHQTREGSATAGDYELNKITSGVGTNNWTMAYPLINTYSSNAQVYQLQQNGNVTINSGVNFYGRGWDGSKGGLVVILSNGTVTINGHIVNNSTGFRGYSGGTSSNGRRGESSSSIGSEQLNTNNGAGGGGGTGGVFFGAGGGGGAGHASSGNAGAGGGTNGIGGQSGSADSDNATLTNLRLGAGGGSGGNYNNSGSGGSGGYGGGAVIIIAKSIVLGGANAIQVNGGAGGNGFNGGDDGGGGGGAGGAILLKAQTLTLGTNQVSAAGGAAGSHQGASGGDGGAGTGGIVAIEYSNAYTGSTTPALTATFNGLLSDPNPQSVKANIKVSTRQDVSVKANILAAGTKQANSVKSNMIKYRGLMDNSVLANFQFTHYEKKYDYRVYDGSTGAYVGSWSSEVISEPNFRTAINSGPGELVVQLKRPIDDFGEGSDITLNNKVELWCADRDQPSGILLFSGTITGYRPILDGHKEYIEITLLHDVAQFSQIMYRQSDNTTTIVQSSQDPSDIFKDIITKYRADGGRIQYSASSIDTTNTTVTYTYSAYTTKDAIDKTIELTPENWYWRVDPDNTFHLHTSNLAAADHTLYIGKHINYMETWRRIEDVVNRIYFVGGGSPSLYRMYSNTGSINSYGLHVTTYNDGRVTDTGTADTMANRLLSQKKDPEIRTTLKILDNNGLDARKGYDIESFKVGQTLRIFGLKSADRSTSLWDQFTWDVDVWDQTIAAAATDVLQIQTITYDPEMVTIEASSRLPVISKRIEDINRNLVQTQTTNTPSVPTVV